jgi:hypothetical protein
MTSHIAAPTRRTVLAGGAALAVAWGLRAPRARAADAPTPTPGELQRWSQASSANGWPVLTGFQSVDVQGAAVTVPLAAGAAAAVLVHLARRFHYEIDSLRPGDVVGGTSDRNVRVAAQSNYLSGTAIGIRPGTYPLGQSGNLFPAQLVVVRDMVAECDGVVGWGGDLAEPMEGHFQLVLPPTDVRVRRLAERFGFTDTLDSAQGAGAVDATDPARRAQARSYARTGRR